METLNKLKEQDILQLLSEYRSQLRRMEFQTEDLSNKIRVFESILKSKGVSEEQLIDYESKAGEIEEEGPADAYERPRKLKRNFPLSEWDKLIINNLKEREEVLINQEILEDIREDLKKKNMYQSEEKAKAKLNQCLVKLANRRGDLVKVRFKGRGFAYALPEWMAGNKLKEQYSKK